MSENLDRLNFWLKSTLIFKVVEGYQYALKINPKNTSVVKILKVADPGPKVSKWMVRFDKPHRNYLYAHINLRHKYTGLKDPHLKLPPGGLAAAQAGAYAGKFLDCICYLTMVYDGIQLGRAIYKDHQDGTWNNTVECGAGVTGQWVGGIVGATAGQAIGALILPGVGPLVCSFGLGWLGVKYGSNYASQSISYWKKSQMEANLKLMKREMAEKELLRFLYFSRLHVNPFCD